VRTALRDNQPCDGPAWGKCLGCASGEYGRVGAAVAVTSVLGQRRRLARKTRGLHSCSHYVQDVLHRHLLEPRATEGLLADVVIPDYRTPEEPGQAVDGLPDEPYVMYGGALRTVKGVDVLLRAYTQLTDPPPLVLIGTRSPDPLPPLPPSAVLIEALPHAQVLRAWQGALFGVAPSLLPEPLGNVIHEAMSAGRPVIGTVPGGQTEMIEDGVNGLLVPSGDVNALAVAMRRLIDDAPLRDRLGQAARTTAERFTEAVQLPRFLALLDQVVDAP
jgi:glycosyltransferase involved in cell wall biosynthesis